jgi:hypothetical protein
VAQARFDRYAQYPESLSMQMITRILDESGNNPQRKQSLEEICEEANKVEVASTP